MVDVQARTVLWHVVFVGFAINYLVCINLNIAIVEMVVPPNLNHSPHLQSSDNISTELMLIPTPPTTQTSFDTIGILSTAAIVTDGITSGDIDKFNQSQTTTSGQHNLEHTADDENIESEITRFHWNEHEQAMALGSFFWTHWITQIPGGILAKKYGTKMIFGLSNVISCWICFLMPTAAYMDLKALLAVRMLQGLLTGLSWPAMHNMTAKWIPPNERSKFITAYFGSAVGVALAYPIFAYIMHWSSWVWVFHITGIVGTLWWLAWLYLAHDTPAQHPRISSKELAHIENSLGNVIQSGHTQETPWLAILTSKSVWMNVIGQWGGVWSICTVMTQAPTYFKVIHDWDIRATGFFSGLPHILRMLFAYVFSLYADYLLRTDKMSRTNVRKLATGISCIVNGLFMLALAYFGTNQILAITFITLATMSQGSGTSGPLSSMVDIAPNFAGIISGICGTIGCMPGFISAYIVGTLTLNNQTFAAWKNVFLICAAVLIGCGVLYVSFADSTLQKWNGGRLAMAEEDDKREQLMQKDVENDSPRNQKEFKLNKL